MAADGERFSGFPEEAFTFYAGLVADNSRAYWDANRQVFERAVRGPLLALTAELAEGFGPFHVFRPHRDVRFSKDKSSYKTHQGAVTEGEGGEAYYLHVDADGLFVASGYHQMARDQLQRFREAVADDTAGPELEALLADVPRRCEVGGRELATAPRGYPRDHPRVELLRHKGLTVGRRHPVVSWVHTRQVVRRVRATWQEAAAVNEWLATHVGPSELPPPEVR